MLIAHRTLLTAGQHDTGRTPEGVRWAPPMQSSKHQHLKARARWALPLQETARGCGAAAGAHNRGVANQEGVADIAEGARAPARGRGRHVHAPAPADARQPRRARAVWLLPRAPLPAATLVFVGARRGRRAGPRLRAHGLPHGPRRHLAAARVLRRPRLLRRSVRRGWPAVLPRAGLCGTWRARAGLLLSNAGLGLHVRGRQAHARERGRPADAA